MPDPDRLSMEDKIAPRLSLDGRVHCYNPDVWRTFCGVNTEPVVGCLPEEVPMCEGCVVATMVGLIIRQEQEGGA